MSKAFTREDDAGEDAPIRPLPTLPPGVKNYITEEGERGLRAELEKLIERRATIAAAKDRALASDVDGRIRRLEQILATVTVVPPQPCVEVCFGSTVKVRYPAGDIEVFRIVGVNEIDLERNYISWQSPLAKALLNAKAGDVVLFKAPAGEQRLEVLEVS